MYLACTERSLFDCRVRSLRHLFKYGDDFVQCMSVDAAKYSNDARCQINFCDRPAGFHECSGQTGHWHKDIAFRIRKLRCGFQNLAPPTPSSTRKDWCGSIALSCRTRLATSRCLAGAGWPCARRIPLPCLDSGTSSVARPPL